MPIKIDAPRAWGWERRNGQLADSAHWDRSMYSEDAFRVHIIRQFTFRKLMALWRAAEDALFQDACTERILGTSNVDLDGLREALDALRGKGEKKCTHTARNASTKTT